MKIRFEPALLLLALLACKKSDSSTPAGSASAESPKPETTAQAAAEKTAVGGVWRGSFKSNTAYAGTVLGLVTEGGDARLVTYGGVQLVGSLKADGDKLSGSLTPLVNHKAQPAVTLDGTATREKTLSGTFKDGSDSGSFQFDYQREYDRPATLAEIADSWANVTFAMKVNDKGLFEGKDAAGCKYTGAFLQDSPRYNAFKLSFTVSDCKHAGEYKGLATLTDQGGAKSRLAYGVSGDGYSHAGVLFRGEELGSEVARRAIALEIPAEAKEALAHANEAVKHANEAKGHADEATAAANKAAAAKSPAEALKAAGAAQQAAGQAAKAAGKTGGW
ncbi:MAG: hypothetical protein R3B13_18775 [Polyangiaceae bacterium]